MTAESRRCTAKSARSGERCKRAPILGGSVCPTHGGRAPQVIRSAKERLAVLVDPALDGLARALKGKDIHAVVRAAKEILDRAGYPAAKYVQLDRGLSLEDLVAQSARPGNNVITGVSQPESGHEQLQANATVTLPSRVTDGDDDEADDRAR